MMDGIRELLTWEQLPRLLAVVSTLVIATAIYALIRRALLRMKRRSRLTESIMRVTLRFVRWLMAPVVLLLVLHQAGYDIKALWAPISAVLAMIAISFVAVWSVVSNVLCTLLILVFRPFQIGDRIELIEPTGTSGLAGTVVDLSFIHATLEEETDEAGNARRVLIPTSIFFQKAMRHILPGATPAA